MTLRFTVGLLRLIEGVEDSGLQWSGALMLLRWLSALTVLCYQRIDDTAFHSGPLVLS